MGTFVLNVPIYRPHLICQNSLTYQRYFSQIVWLEALDFSSVFCNIIRSIRKYWFRVSTYKLFFVFYGKKLY